jgi:hypothetical protein
MLIQNQIINYEPDSRILETFYLVYDSILKFDEIKIEFMRLSLYYLTQFKKL